MPWAAETHSDRMKTQPAIHAEQTDMCGLPHPERITAEANQPQTAWEYGGDELGGDSVDLNGHWRVARSCLGSRVNFKCVCW